MKLKLVILISLMQAFGVQAATIGNDFMKHFSIDLPESYTVAFAGGKKGEKQFSIYDDQHRFRASIFVYYDGLDPRRWKFKHNEESGEFLYVSGDVFVCSRLPQNLSLTTRETFWDMLSSIERKLQPVDADNPFNPPENPKNQLDD